MISGLELLRNLAPGVVPTSGSASGSTDFSAMLQRASAGLAASGKPVGIAPNSTIELSPEQLQRLSAAADKAEAGGLTSALVLIDGRALKLDVKTRTITGEVSTQAAPLIGIDGVVSAQPAQPGNDDAASAQGSTADPAGTLPLPGYNPANPSLARLLLGGVGTLLGG